jgi:arsenate reductase-like glutaredoxin family protein
MSYICEKAARREGCAFRVGKIILQRPIEREQVKKILTVGRTDLLEKFISKKGRPFKASLVWQTGGKVGFEFEAKSAKKPSSAKTKEAEPKIDFSKAERLATCPVCGSGIFEAEYHYVCEKSQAEKKPCKFKVPRSLLQQPIDRAQLKKLVESRRTDLFTHFISKAGKPFPAFLILDEANKVAFNSRQNKMAPSAARRFPTF